jgi:hypothetical protein
MITDYPAALEQAHHLSKRRYVLGALLFAGLIASQWRFVVSDGLLIDLLYQRRVKMANILIKVLLGTFFSMARHE